MASYEEKKKIAVGFVMPAADPFSGNIFDVEQSMTFRPSSDIQNLAKTFEGQIEEQIRYRSSLEIRDEYESDKKTAEKNFKEIKKLLLAGDAAQLEKFFVRKPAADWLNIVFLEETEIDELMNSIKTASTECQAIVATAIEKELKRLVNFKAKFEQILKM